MQSRQSAPSGPPGHRAAADREAPAGSRAAGESDGKPVQRQSGGMRAAGPRVAAEAARRAAILGGTAQLKPAGRGLPEGLKSGVEALSGIAMDDVAVHYNSSKPAGLGAAAYAQGKDIHVAPGQERHLPHEAWHVVQQAQGRVKPTLQLRNSVPVNDDAGLEREADRMGSKALSRGSRRRA